MTVFINGVKYKNVHKVDFEREDLNVAIIVNLTFQDGTVSQERVFDISSIIIHQY